MPYLLEEISDPVVMNELKEDLDLGRVRPYQERLRESM
jgi:hypothetical protein